MTQVLGIIKEGKLVPQQMWIRLISSMENDFSNLETNLERARRELAEEIIEFRRHVTWASVGNLIHDILRYYGGSKEDFQIISLYLSLPSHRKSFCSCHYRGRTLCDSTPTTKLGVGQQPLQRCFNPNSRNG